jgi:transcription termination/antitermination protein NusA
VLVDLGKIEAVLPPAEQVPGERYVHGERIRCYVLHVRKGHRGPSVTLSRTHPGLVKKLFALEVPEIAAGAVEIVALAREAGHRTKIAVRSHQPGVNAKGACIGPMGSRVRNVMNELHGEKMDIVDYSDDPAGFVANALSPARVSRVHVVDAAAREAQVIVPDYQLSLAIGKEGQNARLAARLTGWRIDIRSDAAPADDAAPAGDGSATPPASAGSRTPSASNRTSSTASRPSSTGSRPSSAGNRSASSAGRSAPTANRSAPTANRSAPTANRSAPTANRSASPVTRGVPAEGRTAPAAGPPVSSPASQVPQASE